MKIADTIKSAHVSACGLYRWTLTRTDPFVHPNPDRWHTAIFVLNNPSVADENIDDPTARRGWDFTQRWGYNRMVFLNTNPYRCPDPSQAKPPSGWAMDINDKHLNDLAGLSGGGRRIVIAAWGDQAHRGLATHTMSQLSCRVYHLGTRTKAGNPRHILYLPSKLQPAVYSGE